LCLTTCTSAFQFSDRYNCLIFLSCWGFSPLLVLPYPFTETPILHRVSPFLSPPFTASRVDRFRRRYSLRFLVSSTDCAPALLRPPALPQEQAPVLIILIPTPRRGFRGRSSFLSIDRKVQQLLLLTHFPLTPIFSRWQGSMYTRDPSAFDGAWEAPWFAFRANDTSVAST